MNLQNEIIAKYQKQYPDTTLKDLSRKTGIQVTRVFRIMNGYDMKLSEYEKFHKLINQSHLTETQNDHLDLYTEYIKSITDFKRKSLTYRYQHNLELQNYKVPMSVLNNSSEHIILGENNVKH